MRFFWGYLKEKIWLLVLLGLCTGLFAAVLWLYDLPAEAAWYGGGLSLAAVLAFGLADLLRWSRKVRALEALRGRAALTMDQLPEPEGMKEEAFHALLLELDETRRTIASASDARAREAADYYTMWVHQIKTPIAAMGLMLQEDPSQRGRELEAELFRVERYVELVLSYLRLGGSATDYLIREQPLDPILRQAVRRYAPLFIRGKVSLELRETEPPKYLYHGTATRFLPSIHREGIRKMGRQYVHLSGDFETAMAVGRRHGIPVVITIDAGAMARDGVAFYRSENGVWLCGHVEPKYFVS